MCNFASPDSTPVPEYSPTCWYRNVAVNATGEQLNNTSADELKMMLSALSGLIKELQAKGDNRWEEVAEQQRLVNKYLTVAIKAKRSLDGVVEPDEVMVSVDKLSLGVTNKRTV